MRSFTYTRQLAVLCTLFFAAQLFANNIHVANVTLADQNTANGTTQVRFDLSWENSWRISVGPANWDAAWVFVKYRVNGNTWRHATINNAGQVAPAEATVEPQDGVGAMIYRATDGSGNIDLQDIELQWDYATDNVDENAVVDVQVFAIEMVYIPEGEFSLGNPLVLNTASNSTNVFYSRGDIFPAFRIPYRVESEDAITVADTPNNLYYNQDNNSDQAGDQLGPVPADFPKGFDAFYIMKYELSQDQWVSFFNTLTQSQKEGNDVTDADGKNTDEILVRNAISWSGTANATTTLPNVALNYVSDIQGLSYLDWAGLRPFTELEYEKACRGTLSPIFDEFAWGNANIYATPYLSQAEGTEDEAVSNPGVGIGNAQYGTTDNEIFGPLRVGIFAASALNATREETGGTYYGVMEMSGNVYERCITVGRPEGRAFTGVHGDGSLPTSGRSNVTGWPNGNGIGVGYRGGGVVVTARLLAVSDRNDGATKVDGGNNRLGIRGARTAQ